MPGEQSENYSLTQRGRLKPFIIGGRPDFFPNSKELDNLLARKRTEEKCPALFPHLPAEAYWLLLFPYLSYFGLQDRLAIEQGKRLKTEAPAFTPGMIQLGDALEKLVQPRAKVAKKQGYLFAQSRPYSLYPDSILYTLALGNSTTLSLFPVPVGFLKNDQGIFQKNLAGLTQDEARETLSYHGRDPAKILEKTFEEGYHPPYLALETRNWVYHVYLIDDQLILSLRHADPAKNLRVFETKPARLLYGPNGLPHPNRDYERRFAGLCQQLVKHTKKKN